MSLSVSHSVGFPLRVGLSAGGGLPSFQCAKTCSSLTLSLSPFTSCCLCYSERMLPVCDASRESSTCVLLQAAFPLGLILSLLVPTHPHTQPHSCPPLYPSPLFKHSVLIHMLRGIPILLPWFYSFRGCRSPHLWGTTHTHRYLWVEFACMPPI